ncbi:MAG: zinc ribbon domain-containing protein, partial [Acidobacteria bacterium]|nr:zinc ribbon domain-containing protein [Acidobacteriota bacterium]
SRPLLGLLAGIGGGAYVLLLGYVNRDSKRRGMSPVLWTLVALLIPNGVGILLYFVLRQPLQSACPQCGNAVQVEYHFCPRCNYKLGPSCARCQRVVAVNDIYCPYCGNSLGNEGAPASSAPVPS